MKPIFSKTKAYLLAHKGMGVAIAIVVVGIGYYGMSHAFAKSAPTKYVLGTVTRGTIISSISGTGQVSASDQLDLKPSATGNVTKVSAVAGQTVKAGDVLAQIDATNALQTERNAEVSLQSAQLTLKNIESPTGSTRMQAEDALSSAQASKTTAATALQKAYDDGFSDISTAIQDITDTENSTDSILYDSGHSPYMSAESIRAYAGDSGIGEKLAAGQAYDAAKSKIDMLVAAYKGASRQSDPATIEALVSQAADAAQSLSDALKNIKTLLNNFQSDEPTVPAALTADQSAITSSISKINSDLSSLLGVTSTITSSKQSISDADRSITEKQESLSDITDPGSTNVASARLDVQAKQLALQDAQQKLAEYSVKAPFDGVVAEIDVKVGDSVSGSTVATIITNQQIATLSLNEIDVAKVKLGDKATLTFDAVSGLSISGSVASIDTLGTVSQGVVTYDVKIAFDTQDDRVKSGMSVTANIITDSKQDVLMVPGSAVKTVGGQSVVQELPNVAASASTAAGVTSATAPQNVPVTTGLSNDSQIEIVSGLNEGDTIVTRTVTAAAQATAATAATGARTGTAVFGGGNATFGGAARAIGR